MQNLAGLNTNRYRADASQASVRTHFLGHPGGAFAGFTPLENVLLTSIAVASATLPLAAGMVSVIPALGMLTEAERDLVRRIALSLLESPPRQLAALTKSINNLLRNKRK